MMIKMRNKTLFLLFLLAFSVNCKFVSAAPDIRGMYDGTYKIVVSDCPESGTYNAILAINIHSQTGNSFNGSATGDFNFGGDVATEYIQLSGTITESGQISGNTSHTFLGTGGVGTFTGQLNGDTLIIINTGHDTFGATCSYIRNMEATREGVTPPSANFTASPTSGYVPLIVNFSDKSTGTVTSWTWYFGDGTSSTNTNPTHTYNKVGNYTVTLTVNGPNGTDTEVMSNYIIVESMDIFLPWLPLLLE